MSTASRCSMAGAHAARHARRALRAPADRFVADFIGQMNLIEGQDRGRWRRRRRRRCASPRRLPRRPTPVDGAGCLAVRPERIAAVRGRRQPPRRHRAKRRPIMGGDLHLACPARRCARPSAGRASPLMPPSDRAGLARDHAELGWDAADLTNPRRRTEKPMAQKTIAFFPEAAFGPALNSVGIAQAVEALGHKAVFLSDPGLRRGLSRLWFRGPSGEPVGADAAGADGAVLGGLHQRPHPELPQVALRADRQLREGLLGRDRRHADMGAEGPAARARRRSGPTSSASTTSSCSRRSSSYGKPWVRIISCSENEIEDPDIPPHLSGCGEDDHACHARYRDRFNAVIRPIHEHFNAFLTRTAKKPYPLGQFFEASPVPQPAALSRGGEVQAPPHAADRQQFQYLEGCVRQEKPYTVPRVRGEQRRAAALCLLRLLGSGDVDLLKRIIAALGKMPVRALVNVGGYKDQYTRRARPTSSSTAGSRSLRSSRRSMRSSITAATTRSPSASISASRRSSCPMSGTATTMPRASRKPVTASACRATTGPMPSWRRKMQGC